MTIHDMIKKNPALLDLYPNKKDLTHIKNIYIAHVKNKRIIENEFSFLQFVSKLHEMEYKPRKFIIIRYDTKKTFTESNIRLKEPNTYQKRLDALATEIKNNKNRFKIKLKQQNRLLEYYPEKTLKMLRDSYGTKERANLIEPGFSFDKYVIKAYSLGYVNSDAHQIRRIDTSKRFSETNVFLQSTDGLLSKLKTMSKIMQENKRVSLKINEEKAFQICLKHPNANERRIYIKQ